MNDALKVILIVGAAVVLGVIALGVSSVLAFPG